MGKRSMQINDQSDLSEGTIIVKQKAVNADGSEEILEGAVVREHFMDILVNERLTARLVCTPSHLPELVLGRLLTEGIISGGEDVESIYICKTGNTAKVFLHRDISLKVSVHSEVQSDGRSGVQPEVQFDGRSGVQSAVQFDQQSAVQSPERISEQVPLRREPTCCTGNRIFLGGERRDHLRRLEGAEWKKEWIFERTRFFAEDSKLHKQTKGTHSCYLSCRGQTVFSCEDIGRHNAMDKCIGYAVLQEMNLKDCILFTTGRVPTDMVQKAVAAGIPVLVSKAVPTDEAIAMAEEYNLTLICRAWPDQFVIYRE